MKTYIKVWVIIALIADIAVAGFLMVKRDSIIRCNRSYKKIYPCHPITEVTNEIPEVLGSYRRVSTKTISRVEDDEPALVVDERIDSDIPVIIEILFVVDLLIAVIATFLYFVISYMANRKPVRGTLFSLAIVALVIGSGYAFRSLFYILGKPAKITEIHYNAPIIYLYDEQEREAAVKLDLNGELTCTYPKYNEENGWIVKTSADGVLTDRAGRQYEYLYWEADMDMVPDFSKGFCVRGEDSSDFLEKALAEMGLSDTEANTFIMYWLPQLEENPYNVIAFQTENYEMAAKLDVDPLPDTVVRVNMLFYGSDEYVEMEEQDLSKMNPSLQERDGLVLVEWGGGKLG